jgi:hypothetical protein
VGKNAAFIIMKLCKTCGINPVKVGIDEQGNGRCWKCWYVNLYGKERGMFIYKSIFKDKVKDENI